MAGTIRVGIGGWTFEPWRGVFYPKGLKQADELAYAAGRLTAIEINGTYYSSQKPETFAKWAAATPDGFVFSLKASRFCTNRKVLAQGAPSIEKFLDQGIVELGDRLGPIVWQFMATKRFEPDDFEAFLQLLPATHQGVRLRHVMEVRHDSFLDPAFVALCRKHGAAVCLAHHATFARLMGGSDDIGTCYPADQLDAWAERLKMFARGDRPDDLNAVDRAAEAPGGDRDVFAFFISEGKINAPSGAMELISICK
jgi:uncharacterized protein YecE (DUF72 family)